MNKKMWREMRNGLIIGIVIVVVGIFIAIDIVHTPYDPTHVRPFVADLFCPEDYVYREEYLDVLGEAVSAYISRYPDATAEEVSRWRYRFLNSNHCEQTLANLRAQGEYTEDDFVKTNLKYYNNEPTEAADEL